MFTHSFRDMLGLWESARFTVAQVASRTMATVPRFLELSLAVLFVLHLLGCDDIFGTSEGDDCGRSEEGSYECTNADDVLQCIRDDELDEYRWLEVDSCPGDAECDVSSDGQRYTCRGAGRTQGQDGDPSDDADDASQTLAACLDSCASSSQCADALTCIDYGSGGQCFPSGCGDCADDGYYCDYDYTEGGSQTECSFTACLEY